MVEEEEETGRSLTEEEEERGRSLMDEEEALGRGDVKVWLWRRQDAALQRRTS